MLGSDKAVSLFHKMKTAGQYAPAAKGALAGVESKVTGVLSRFEVMRQLPDLSGDGGGGAPTIPPTAKALEAVARLEQVQPFVQQSKALSGLMGGEIDLRLSNVMNDIQMIGIGGKLLEKAGTIISGCPAIQDAMSPLTDISVTVPIDTALGDFDVALPDFDAALEQAKSGIDSLEIQQKIDAGLAKLDELKSKLEPLNQQLNEAISRAKKSYEQLKTAINDAVNVEVLLSLQDDPCLKSIADAAIPSELKDELNKIHSP